MPEADAEDGLHGRDAYLAGMNGGAACICIERLTLQVCEPFPRPAAIQFCIPHAKIRKNGKRRGEGSRGGVGGEFTRRTERITAESNREREYRTGTRAERAKSSVVLAKIGSSVF